MGRASSGLIGRDRELAVGRRHIDAVAQGASASILIEGEAGIGKSELVASLLDAASEAGLGIQLGGAHPFDQSRPFGVVVDALGLRVRSSDPRRAAIARLLLGTEPTAPTSALSLSDMRYVVIDDILDMLDGMCAASPQVVVFEDLHWADDSSITAIASMGHALRHAPLLLIATYRPAPRPRRLAMLIDDLATNGAALVRLHELDHGDVSTLVAEQLGGVPGPVLASIVAKARGNPLWITEMLRSLSAEGWLRRDATSVEAAADELPGSFRELVLRRLGYLPAAALEILDLVSVLGDAVSIQDLATVTGRTRSELLVDLDEAFRSRLLDEHDDAVVFRHQLLQQAIYEALPVAKRRALHRDAADAFTRAGADLGKVASHLVRGADHGDVDAVRLLRAAADDALHTAPAIAVELLDHARSLLPAGHDDTDRLASQLAEAMMQAGLVAEAAALATSVIDRRHGDDVDVALRLTLVSALSLLNQPRELTDRAESTLQTASLTPAQQALVLAQASYGRTFSGDFIGGEATARRAVEVAERSGDASMTVWSRCALTSPVRLQGRYADALAIAERAVREAFEPADRDARLRHPHFFLGMTLVDCDRPEEARQAYARAIEDAGEFGTGWLLPDMLQQSGEAQLLFGRWDDAASEFEAGLALAEEHGQRILTTQTRGYQAMIAAARGDLDAAHRALAGVERELSGDSPAYGSEIAAFASAVIAEAEGDAAGALKGLHRFWNIDLRREVRYYQRWLGPMLVRLALELDEGVLAAGVASAAEAGAAIAPEVPTVESAALRCRGLVARDPDLMVAAVEAARRGQRVIDLGGACEDAASLLAGAGRNTEAKALLFEALEAYERLGAAAWATRVASSLRRLGVRRGARGARDRPAFGWDSLTDSERAVAQLVAQGLTNRDVARRLHVSPHTVNTHLRHAFQKLSVTTRTQLAAEVAGALNHANE